MIYELNFPNYQNHNDNNEVYHDFIQETINVIDKVGPIKERRVKRNSQEWFDGEIADRIKNRDRLFETFKIAKLHIGKDIYKASRYKLLTTIINKNSIL